MKHTLVLKVWMALSGLYLMLFLVVHLLGNLQLFLPSDTARVWFNAYSSLLASNPLIKVAAWLTYASVAVHVLVSWILARRNRASRPYEMEAPQASSPWYSRYMGALGLLLLGFLVVHMRDFWVPYHYGPIGEDSEGRKDLYGVVVSSFRRPWVVLGYVVCMAALGFHLQHGFRAAFHSLGVYGGNATRLIRRTAPWFAWLIAGAFAAMPLFVFLTR